MREPHYINPAQLLIPSEAEHAYLVHWRLAIIQKYNIYPTEELANLLKKTTKGSTQKISAKEKREIFKAAVSNEVNLDELDLLILFIVKRLSKDLSDEEVLAFDRTSRLLKKFGQSFTDEYIQMTRSNLKNYAQILLTHEVQKMRAKFAFKELAALISPDEIIPHLVGLSVSYLSSPISQKWIRKQKYLLKYEKVQDRKAADANLRSLFKAIKGDLRANKKRRRPYWRIAFDYHSLSDHILNFRQQKTERKLDGLYFKMYCDEYRINEINRNLILHSKQSPSELALSILEANGDIKTSKTFREFQAYLNEIQKAHFGGNIMSIATELIPLLVDFLDLPGTRPDIIEASNLTEVLEMVKL